ncbi:MAG TPA: hypothetical protein ENI27_01240 [bacterium]|nr:hypothetical protein [bacterium]
MDYEPQYFSAPQLTFFDIGESSPGVVELFPAVWSSAEALTTPDAVTCLRALDRLEEMDAARLSPLVAYLMATRLADPNIELRTRVVQILGDLLTPNQKDKRAPDAICNHLTASLSQLRTREVFALLQVIVHNPTTKKQVARLLNSSPFAGTHLVEILASSKVLLTIRKQAARIIGLVGYVDAIPALERIANRLESRINGQQVMSFIPMGGVDDIALLPEVISTLDLLNSP